MLTWIRPLASEARSGTETAEVEPIEAVSSAEQLGEPISLDILLPVVTAAVERLSA